MVHFNFLKNKTFFVFQDKKLSPKLKLSTSVSKRNFLKPHSAHSDNFYFHFFCCLIELKFCEVSQMLKISDVCIILTNLVSRLHTSVFDQKINTHLKNKSVVELQMESKKKETLVTKEINLSILYCYLQQQILSSS